MRSLFSPAVALMNTLRYTSKFALLGLAMGAVMLSLLFTVYVNLNRDIEAARLELNGLQVLKPMNKLAQFMQQHRGLSSGVLNGNEAMKEKRAAKEKEVVMAGVTKVWFDHLSDAEIAYYIDTCKPYDKAGAYGAQEWIGHCKIRRIEGTFPNIMGLPVDLVYEALKGFEFTT